MEKCAREIYKRMFNSVRMKYKDRKVEICINCGNKDHIIAKSMCNN